MTAGGNAASVQPTGRQLVWTFVAVPATVTAARHAASAFVQQAGAGPSVCENVALAVSEAVTNVVLHAYPDAAGPGDVQIRASVTDDTLHVAIADDGRGMQGRPDSPGLGLGIGLMQKVSQGFDICERESGGVELRMTFALAEAET